MISSTSKTMVILTSRYSQPHHPSPLLYHYPYHPHNIHHQHHHTDHDHDHHHVIIPITATHLTVAWTQWPDLWSSPTWASPEGAVKGVHLNIIITWSLINERRVVSPRRPIRCAALVMTCDAASTPHRCPASSGFPEVLSSNKMQSSEGTSAAWRAAR